MGFPVGVKVIPLERRPDPKGTTTDFFVELAPFSRPLRWAVLHSPKASFRGMYIHPLRNEYVVLVSGLATIGLKDFRKDSPTEGVTATLEVDGFHLVGIYIPQGVAYGIVFEEESVHIRAVFKKDDSALVFRGDEPDLGISWPHEVLAEHGQMRFLEIRHALEIFQPIPIAPLSGQPVL